MATISESFAIAVRFHQAGRLPEAKRIYQQILAAKPDHADALHLLGVIASQSGQFDVAIDCIGRAIVLNANDASYHCNLGNAFKGHRKFDKAIACYRRALGLKPDLIDAYYNLGNSLYTLKKLDEAVACYRRTLQLRPNWAEAHCNLGNTFDELGHLNDAIQCYQTAVLLKPDFVVAHNNLGNVFKLQGRLEESIACYRLALQIKPDYAQAHSNLLYTHQYRDQATLSDLAAMHAEYERLHASRFQSNWRPHQNDRDPERRLRVGFVSPDFARHPVGYFLIQCLENLGRFDCDTICYSDRIDRDDFTKRFHDVASLWRNVSEMDDQKLADTVVADKVDILFDLAGHTAHNRLLVFARRPAPVQITWLGYEGTTGLNAIDYLLADEQTIPSGVERFYREQILRMPHGYVCYDPPKNTALIGPPPALKNGFVQFGCFNNPAKITRVTVESWARILRRLPQSRLVLKYRALSDEQVRDRYLKMFQACDTDLSRIEFAPKSECAAYFEALSALDIALDPIPFGGGITTCDSLWMGVPVITKPGNTFASRHSMSHVIHAGLSELVAKEIDDYVELAVALASDLPRLAAIRSSLRDRMAASPLCNGKLFAMNLMAKLREVWRRWCLSCEATGSDDR